MTGSGGHTRLAQMQAAWESLLFAKGRRGPAAETSQVIEMGHLRSAEVELSEASPLRNAPSLEPAARKHLVMERQNLQEFKLRDSIPLHSWVRPQALGAQELTRAISRKQSSLRNPLNPHSSNSGETCILPGRLSSGWPWPGTVFWFVCFVWVFLHICSGGERNRGSTPG